MHAKRYWKKATRRQLGGLPPSSQVSQASPHHTRLTSLQLSHLTSLPITVWHQSLSFPAPPLAVSCLEDSDWYY
jgi:hypothetical protein